jgi:hypothetical protein
MLILRTSGENRRSYGGFLWPKSGRIEAPDWNPLPIRGYGLHGLAHGRGNPVLLRFEVGATWQVVEVEDHLVVDLGGKVKFPYGEVLYSGEMEGALALIAGGADKIREWVCQDAQWSFYYASDVDKGPRDDTRAGACEDPGWAYEYACSVDKGPRDDTRAGACKDPTYAFWYASDVDKGPHDDTRTPACLVPYRTFMYALKVDKGHHPETRAALEGSSWLGRYEEIT